MNFQDWNFWVTLGWMISIKTNWMPAHRTQWLCKMSFLLVSVLFFPHCHLTEISLIFLVSWWVLITLSFKNPETRLWICALVCAERGTLLVGCSSPPQKMPMAASLLWSIILSVKRVILVITPLRVIEEEFFRFSLMCCLIFWMLIMLFKVSSNLFISLTPKRVIMFIERLNFRPR